MYLAIKKKRKVEIKPYIKYTITAFPNCNRCTLSHSLAANHSFKNISWYVNQFLDWRGVCSAPSTVTSLLKLPLITFFLYLWCLIQSSIRTNYCQSIVTQLHHNLPFLAHVLLFPRGAPNCA